MTLYLLDAYALIYRAYYAFLSSSLRNSHGEDTGAIFGFTTTLQDLLRTMRPDAVAVCFDPPGGTFRHEAYPQYKAQREATPESIRFAVPWIKQIVEAYGIQLLEVRGYEADDVAGTVAKRAEAEGWEVSLFTPDKDYAQLVSAGVRMCRPGHGAQQMEVLDEAAVCKKYDLTSPLQVIDLLALMGDKADNIPGCPGVGEKTAVKLLTQYHTVEELLERADEIPGALGGKVRAAKDEIRFSKFLTTIKTDTPLPDGFTVDALRLGEPDVPRLTELFRRLELFSLLKRLPATGGGEAGENSNAAAKSGSANASVSGGNLDGGSDFSENSPSQTAKTPVFTLQTSEKEEDLTANFFQENGAKKISAVAEWLQTASGDPLLGGIFLQAEGSDTVWHFRRPSPTPESADATSAPTPADDGDDDSAFGALFASAGGADTASGGADMPDAAERWGVEDAFLRLVTERDAEIITHDAKPLHRFIQSRGREPRAVIRDTMLAHYLLQPEQQHGLALLAKHWLDEEIPVAPQKTPRTAAQKPDADALTAQHAAETAVLLRLHGLLEKELRATECWMLYDEVELPLTAVLVRMERQGVRLDEGRMAEVGTQFAARIAALEAEIFALAGHEFMLTSPRQVGAVLFDELRLSEKPKKTKGGQYQTGEDVLEALKDRHPIVEKILQHRALKKLQSTYVEALPRLVNARTGRLHTTFNQAVTATGRLSSSNPNLQNIPVRGEDGREIRRAFVADAGEVYVSADYSQIELRLLAHLSADEHLLADFRQGHDVHAATAARIFHKSVDDISRDERRKAKTANFGIIYGISAFGLAERMEVSRSEAKELIESYFSTYPGVRSYIDRCVEQARADGFVTTLFHRRRYLPDITSRNAVVRGFSERNAVNAPIQGTAADIIKIAMVRIDRRLRQEGLRAKMLLQVHDELNFSCPPEEVDRLCALVHEEMERFPDLSVPLTAESGVGECWLDAH